MDSDLAFVNGKSGRQSWRYADAFQSAIISEAIYHLPFYQDLLAEMYRLQVIFVGSFVHTLYSLCYLVFTWIITDCRVDRRYWALMMKLLSCVQLLDHSDPTARQLVSRYRWYILPLANPDGYVFTWNTVTMSPNQCTQISTAKSSKILRKNMKVSFHLGAAELLSRVFHEYFHEFTKSF